MPNYTPTTDVFARFVEGLKFGAGLRDSAKTNALQDMQVQKLAEDMARAKRSEALDFQYASGGQIYSGEDYDRAQRVTGPGSTPKFRTLQDVPGPQALPTPTTGALDIRTVPTKPNVTIPAAGTTGLQGYGVPFSQTQEFIEAQPDLERYTEGLTQMAKPVGLNVQTDASGARYIPGRKRGDKPTILPPEGGLQVFEQGGQQFYAYPTTRGTQYGQVTPAPVAINEETGQQADLPRGAKIIKPSGMQAAKETATKMEALENSIGLFETYLNKAPAGRVLGTIAGLVNSLTGYMPEVSGIKDAGGLIKPMLTRVIGGDVGNLSAPEQVAAKRLTEDMVGATKAERAQALYIMRTLLEFRKQANNKRLQGGGMWNAETAPLSTADIPQYKALVDTISANPNVPLSTVIQNMQNAQGTTQQVQSSTGTASTDLW